jgi:hypothetical protein
LLDFLDTAGKDKVFARWHTRFVLEARGITVDEAALALEGLRALMGPSRGVGFATLQQIAEAHGLSAVALRRMRQVTDESVRHTSRVTTFSTLPEEITAQ